MYVFYDVATGKVMDTARGEIDLIEGRTDWIEVPDQDFISLTSLSVVNGVLVETKADPVYQEMLRRAVDLERDRRMKAGLPYAGTIFDFDDVSKSGITGMATLAGFAIGAGAQPGDLYWHGGSSPFVWVAQDNSFVPMDAPTTFGLGQAAATHEMTYIFVARTLKDLALVPEDYANDIYWP